MMRNHGRQRRLERRREEASARRATECETADDKGAEVKGGEAAASRHAYRGPAETDDLRELPSEEA